MIGDLHELPKLRDSISYIYVEHAVIEQRDSSISILRKDGRIQIPVAAVTCLLLGPGTTVTHAAIKTICDNGCMAVWCGENVGRFYATGAGETRSAANLLRQAALCMDPESHMKVVKRMYIRRFSNFEDKNYTLQQLRGMEGIRVRETYRSLAKQFNVEWKARDYKIHNWADTDPVNRALSEANALLYSLCQAAIVSLGYSPALGFIHTGKMLSFVYDIADLYKAETSIPAAFEAAGMSNSNLSRQVRLNCRKYFQEVRLLQRIAQDLAWLFAAEEDLSCTGIDYVGELWDEQGVLPGGKIYTEV